MRWELLLATVRQTGYNLKAEGIYFGSNLFAGMDVLQRAFKNSVYT